MEAVAADFLAETEALCELLAPLPDDYFSERPTGFKDWTLDSIIAHLHSGNHMAQLSLVEPKAFLEIRAGRRELGLAEGLSGQALLRDYVAFARTMAASWATQDPKARLEWYPRSPQPVHILAARSLCRRLTMVCA